MKRAPDTDGHSSGSIDAVTEAKPLADGTTILRGFASVAEFDSQHHHLLELQGSAEDDRQLVGEVHDFIARGRPLGAMLESPRDRQDCQSILNYWSIFAYRAAHEHIEADLLPFDPERAPSLDDEQFPYRFERDAGGETQQMLGWRRLLDECERDLADDHLLAVVSDSVDDSKLLIHALLLPMLREGRARLKELQTSHQWRYRTVSLGDRPLHDFLAAIAEKDGHDSEWVERQHASARLDDAALKRILETGSEDSTLLVFSRFDAILKAPAIERDAFVRGLSYLLEDQRFYVITDLPRDRCFALSRFGPLEGRLSNGHVLVAFTTAELRHLIEEPARRVGLIFEAGLVDKILIDVQGEPSALPLLQFTLARLWEVRERNRITRDAYNRRGAGRHALRVAIEETWQELNSEQQGVLRQLLLTMVTLKPDGSFDTVPVSHEDLSRTVGSGDKADAVIGKLRKAGLLRERSSDGQPLLELCHKPLLTAWPPLVAWLDELRVKERFRLRLREAAALWETQGMPRELLWQGGMLIEADKEFGDRQMLSTPERRFLDASRRREDRKKRIRAVAIGAAMFAALAIAVFGPLAHRRAEDRERLAVNATNSLRDGDLPGALLWLDARNGLFDRILGKILPGESRDPEIRQLAQLQLPSVSLWKAERDDEGKGQPATGKRDSENATGAGSEVSSTDDVFNSVAVSSDSHYLAAIRTEKDLETNGEKLYVELSSLEDPAAEPVVLNSSARLKGTSGGAPTAIFVPVGSGEGAVQCLLVANGELSAWLETGQDPRDWRRAKIKLPATADVTESEPSSTPGDAADAIAYVTAAGNPRVLMVQVKNGQRLLQLCELERGSEPDQLRLQPLQRLPIPDQKQVQFAVLSKDGHVVAFCGKDRSRTSELVAWRHDPARGIWELATPPGWSMRLVGTNEQRLQDWGWVPTEHGWNRVKSIVRAGAFAPEDDMFATACEDGQVLVWNLYPSSRETPAAGGAEAVVSPLMETELWLGSSVFDVKFVTDDVLITGGRDRTARVWDVHAGAEVAPRTYHEGTVSQVAFAEPGTLITKTQHVVRIWRSESYEKLKSPTVAQQVAVSGDLRRLVRAGSWPGIDDEESVPNVRFRSTVLSRDGKWLFTASSKRGEDRIVARLRRWEEQLGSALPLQFPNGLASVPHVAFAASGNWMAAAYEASSKSAAEKSAPQLSLWKLESGAKAVEPTAVRLKWNASDDDEAPAAIVFNAIATAEYKKAETLVAEVLVLAGKATTGGSSKGVVFVGVRAPEADPSEMAFYALAPQGTYDAFPHEEEVLCVAFSKNGDFLATGDAHDCVKLWKVEDLIRRSAVAESTPKAADGEGHENARVRQLVVRPLAELDHSSNVEAVAFAPTDDSMKVRVATVSSEGEACIWSVSKGDGAERLLYNLRHDAKILTISYSPDGEWIITGGEDRTARVWSSEKGQLLGVFMHQGPVSQAWVLKDGRVVTVSRSSRVSSLGEDPLSHVRHWQVLDQPAGVLSREDLHAIAARQVAASSRLEGLAVEDFADHMAIAASPTTRSSATSGQHRAVQRSSTTLD